MARSYSRIVSSSTAESEFTGSICKLLAVGGAGTEATASRIEFGVERQQYGRISSSAQPEWNAKTVSGQIFVPTGTSIEGPIGRVKVSGGSNGFLVFFGPNEFFE